MTHSSSYRQANHGITVSYFCVSISVGFDDDFGKQAFESNNVRKSASKDSLDALDNG